MESFFNTISGIKVWRYPMPGIDANMYIIIKGRDALVIDPNNNQTAVSFLKQNEIEHVLILLTHEHFDHISGVNMLRKHFDSLVVCSEEASLAVGNPNKNMAKFWEVTLMDKPDNKKMDGLAVRDDNYSCTADVIFKEEYKCLWNGHKVHALTAPGHSKGNVLYFLDKCLFSGDSLVNGVGVICRLPGGSWASYREKTKPIIECLDDNTMVFPGHGAPDILKNLRKYLVKFGSKIEE